MFMIAFQHTYTHRTAGQQLVKIMYSNSSTDTQRHTQSFFLNELTQMTSRQDSC